MSSPVARQRSGGLVDRRLAARASVTRRYLAVAVAVGLVATASVVAQAVLLATVVERVLMAHATLHAVAPWLVGLAVAFAVRAACLWAGEAAAHRTSAAVTSTLRRQLVRQAVALGPGWLAGERAGELSLSATRGIDALDAYFGRYLPQAVLAGLAPVGILAWVAWEDWPSFLVLLGLVALVPVAMILFGRESAKQTRRQWRRLSALSARFLDLVQGLPTLRAFGREGQGRREVAQATEALRVTTMRTLRVAFLSALAMEFLAGVGTGLVAMVLGLRLLGGSVSLYTALAVLLVSPEVFLPLRRAGSEFHASAEGQAAAARILDVLDQSPEETGAPASANAPEPSGRPGDAGPPRPDVGAAAPDPLAAPLGFSGVSVHFPGRAEPALEDVTFTVAPGEHVALVGPSGAGKSTVLAVLLGFVRPQAGSILVGDVDLAGIPPAAWRRRITWVPQRPHLLQATLAENLRVADPGAGPDRLAWALELAGLGAMVAELPRGLDTPVGEQGLTLSAGERQRLAIARAVLRDAPLVLMDEPVAHLDATTESVLRERLAPWLEERSVLVAAHRPELVARIDRVVTLSPTAPPAGGPERRAGEAGGSGAGENGAGENGAGEPAGAHRTGTRR